MGQSKEKIAQLLLYLVDIISLFLSYILSGLIWLVMYKGMDDANVSNQLGFEVGALVLSYAFIIIFFNANGTFFKRDKLAEFASVVKINLLFAALFVVVLFAKRSADIFSRGVYFLTIILNIVSIYNIYNLNNEYNYIENIINKEYKYVTYNLYVQKKNTTYNELEKLSGKKTGLLTNKNNITYHLNQKTNIECIKYKNIEDLANAINNGEIQSFILIESEYELLKKYTDLSSKTRIIYTNKIIDTI